ncbi:phospho-N-acetylmuramoyl-pentapeptide-transferase [candidate division KSB1 bacterium]
MGYFLSELYHEYFLSDFEFLSFLRLFNYISFRASFAFLTAFLISLVFGRKIITRLYRQGLRETAREVTDIVIKDKRGTPTMGGTLIILSITVSILIWGNLTSIFVLWSLAALIYFGIIGFIDDRSKVKAQSSETGLSRSRKLFMQGLFGLVLSLCIYSDTFSPFPPDIITNLYIPFVKAPIIDLSWFYIPFAIFVILSISNAVNFADGLDGLAIVPSCTAVGVYGIFAYIIGNKNYAEYLLFDYMEGYANSTGEITVIAAAVIGAGLGFLWFNAYPAQVFMGDTGSQALGGLIATIALLLKQEFLFLIAGGIFLAEAVSVLMQDRIGIARIGRRLFFRAPLHHSFQYRGIPESTVVVRFWIISVLLALMSILSIKIR